MKRTISILLLFVAGIFICSYYLFEGEANASKVTQVAFDPEVKLWPPVHQVDSINLHVDQSKPLVRSYKVRYGDSFIEILKSLELPSKEANALAYQIAQIFDLKQFQVGNEYLVYFDPASKVPQKLIYDLKERQELLVDFRLKKVVILDKVITTRIRSVNTKIQSSLAQTVIQLGASEDLSDRILSALAWKVDFDHLLAEDHFKVIYEEESTDGQIIGTGDILYLAFTHDGKTYYGIGFDNGNGTEYFDENGHNLSHAPLRFDKITSLYAQKRFHPIRRSYRAHYGMDFEAAEGTPIEAIKDGVITRSRYDRANGNNIKIMHSSRLTTQYLHLSAIDSSIYVGGSVKQGQIIGYVGSTGLSSGPHLCLRVWHDGRQRDPLNFDFPRRADIKPELMEEFEHRVASFQERTTI